MWNQQFSFLEITCFKSSYWFNPGLIEGISSATGVINKSLVASINALGGRAIGISGADGNMVSAEIADPELGYVGKIRSVDTAPIEAILEGGYNLKALQESTAYHVKALKE